MKIQKFGTIRFTDSGLPVFEGFMFVPESEEEQQALHASKPLYLQKVMEEVAKHFVGVYNRNAARLDELAERDMNYDQPIGSHSKSPVDIVNEFLSKAGKP
ncbi:hypothetical protein H0088_004119 [Salmonella enterica]|nr:hypothetical protein [Salmonella enterica]